MDFKAVLKKRMLEEASGSTEDSLKAAVTSLEKAKEANKKIQDQGTAFMENSRPGRMTSNKSWRHQVPDPSDMLQHYLPAMRALQNGQNPWADNPKLLEEMPDLKHTASTPGADGAAVTGPGMATLNEMDEEAKKLAMLLWALKVHRGELRMFGGVWRRVPEFSPPLPDWAQPKPGALTPKEVDRYRALERRTHPSSFGADMVEPFHYTDQEVEAQRQEGTRPPLGSILSIWWADDTDKDEKWRRESGTWDLKSLIHIYSTRYTFKYIYSLWCSLPLAIEAKQRGKDAPTGRLGMVQVPWALYPLHHLPVNQSVEPAFTWMTDIPDRLRRRLHWTRVPLPPEAKPTILLLYAGKDDAGSLDSYLHAWPVRGRSEQQVWGLPANATEEQLDTDNDSMLVLRQMISAATTLGTNPLGDLQSSDLSKDEQLVTSLFERVTPGVVSIAKEVVTNYNVINEMQTPYVTFLLNDKSGNKRLTFLAQVVGYDTSSNVAVLEVQNQDNSSLPKGLMQPLERGHSDKLMVGQNVFAFGNPFGLEHSLSRGIISGVSRKMEGSGGRPISGVIQTDASINPGNSGGPLLNSDGEVIGVNTAILSGSGMFAGVGLAVPIDTVSKNVESIISKGFVKRPLLGLIFAPDVMDQELQLNGIMVMKVIPGGPAENAGVRPMRGGRLGDVVVAMDGQNISSTDDLFGLLESRAPGDTVKLKLQRPNADLDSDELQEIEVPIKLGQANKPGGW
ncbi:unnamed protein product [Durusdinium trenchii]|uniref:PDZ domain-containing protein n=1 Tax=Durusdinium trenchii TaxID=1381693 RepID=A0ABP0RS40_9DINO